MIIYLIITALALVLALMVRDTSAAAVPGGNGFSGFRPGSLRRSQVLSALSAAAIFLTLVIPASLRVNIGNDYAKYVDFMHLIRADAYVPTEAGFNLLVKVLYILTGYENYLLVFCVISCLTVGIFLYAIFHQADSFFLSFYFFLTFGYYFQTYNTVRYYLALAMALAAVKLLLRKEYLPFAAVIVLAATFHKSVLVVLVLYPLASLRFRRIHYVLLTAAAALMLPAQSLVMKAVVFLYPSYENTEYLEGSGFSPAGILRCALCLLLWAYVRRFGEKVSGARAHRENFYFNCSYAAFLLNVFCSFLPILTRITTYLTVTQIFFLPALLADLPRETDKDRKRVTILLALLLLFGAGTLALYLHRMASPSVKILPYMTFLFDDMPKTLSEVND